MAGMERSFQPVALMQKETNINHCNPRGSWGCSLLHFGRGFMKSANVSGDTNAPSQSLQEASAGCTWRVRQPQRAHVHTFSGPRLIFTPRANHSSWGEGVLGKIGIK